MRCRRSIAAMVAGVVVALFAAVVLALPAVADGTRVSVVKVPEAALDVQIFMTVNATHGQVAAVEHAIRESDDVDRYARLSKRDAYDEFTRIFSSNTDLIATTTPADLPQSFRVVLRTSAHAKAWAKPFNHMAGVDSAKPKDAHIPTQAKVLDFIHDCQVADADVRVFMHVGVTPAQVDAATVAVAAEPGLTITRVFSKADAYDEFRKIFANKPDLLRSVQPGDVPVSIAVHPAGELSPDVLQRLRAIDGVDSVEVPSALCETIRSVLASGYTPEELARVIVAYGASGDLPA